MSSVRHSRRFRRLSADTISLHTNARDEALELPTQASAQVALRTQQIIAYQTGITNVADPRGGGYHIEGLDRSD
jgi:methylmalonyl-CoA mutase N-terminal domain/subunit